MYAIEVDYVTVILLSRYKIWLDCGPCTLKSYRTEKKVGGLGTPVHWAFLMLDPTSRHCLNINVWTFFGTYSLCLPQIWHECHWYKRENWELRKRWCLSFFNFGHFLPPLAVNCTSELIPQKTPYGISWFVYDVCIWIIHYAHLFIALVNFTKF